MTEIKLITKDSVLPTIKLLDWDVVINDRPYYAGYIPGYVHSIGGRWGENDIWAWPRDEDPCYENLVEFSCNDPVCWGIEFTTENGRVVKYGETEARTYSGVTITRNGKKFCRVPGSMYYAVDKARTMITEFQEHPLALEFIGFGEKAIGRKVWWRSEPGVITDYIHGQACVCIEPDGIDQFTIPAEFAEEDPDYYCDGFVKTSILDKHIWWFRE